MDKRIKTLINLSYYAGIAILLYLVVQYLLPVLLPFLLAFAAAMILRGAAGRIYKKVPIQMKYLTIGLTLAFYILLLAGILFAGSRLIPLAGDFASNLPEIYRTDIQPFIEELSERLEDLISMAGPSAADIWESGIASVTQNMEQTVSTLSMNVVSAVPAMITKIPSAVVLLVVTVISTFFMASDYEKITAFIKHVLPPKGIRFCRNVKTQGFHTIKIYVKSYSILMILTFVELLIGFWILKIPYAGWIALAIAVFDILPILGTGGILLPWALIACLVGEYPMAAGVLILYIVITIIRNMAEPKLVGKQMGIHPLATLIAMFAGVNLFGIIGLIGFPMILSILIHMRRDGELSFSWTEKEEQPENIAD